MATFTEASVVVTVSISKDGSGNTVVGTRAQSFTAGGAAVRDQGFNITQFLTAEEIADATNLVNRVEVAVKNQWSIP